MAFCTSRPSLAFTSQGPSGVLFRPRELGNCRETLVLPFIGALNLVAATATKTREVKAAAIWVVSGFSGLVLGVSALNSTGASGLTSAHNLYSLDHFLPLLPTSYTSTFCCQ